MNRRRRKTGHSGFTLTELGIVMCIAALILGGLWEAVASIYMRRNIQRVEQQWQLISNAVIAMGNRVGTSSNTVMTPILAQANVFPADMIDLAANKIHNPWTSATISNSFFGPAVVMTGRYNSFYGFTQAATPVDAFEIGYDGIPREACITLVHEMTSPAIADNVKSIFINTYWPVIIDGTNTTTMSKTVPLDEVVSACDPASNATGYDGTYIDIVYMLKR